MLSGCDLGKGEHRAAGKGVQKSVWFSCAIGLLRAADAWGPERTAMRGSTEQTPVFRDAEDTGIWSQSGWIDRPWPWSQDHS